jgi:DNA-binding transcriptional regulator WhiA
VTKQIKEPKSINEDLAWLLGVICGDGCLEKYGKSRHQYRISLSTIDMNFGKLFVMRINRVFKLNEKFNSKIVVNNTNSKYYKVQIDGKQLYEFFMKFGTFGCFKWKVPKQILNGSTKIKQSFLRGYYDSEGSLNTYRKKYRKIRAASVNKDGIKGIQKLLNDLKIDINLIKEKNCYSLNIYKEKQINHFNNSVGFSFKN